MLRTHNRPGAAATSRGTSNRAFTLIELLIVIGIIGLLIAITLAVGGQVAKGGKERLTRDTLRVLDTALSEYINANDGIPDAMHLDRVQGNINYFIPVADARDMEHDDQTPAQLIKGNQMINSVGLFIEQVKNVPKAKTAIDSLPTKVIRLLDPDNPDPAALDQRKRLTVMDAWGRPIRYVHPAFDGLVLESPGDTTSPRDVGTIVGPPSGSDQYSIGKIRRNRDALPPSNPVKAEELADSDGGVCVGNRPYFYSAGPDGKVGYDPATETDHNADNIYSTAPTFQKD
mgnify:CR=1 FL=1